MAAISTTQTFSSNEQITSTKLTNILANSVVASGAVTGDDTLKVDSGQLRVFNLKSSNFPASVVTSDAVAASAITPAKLSLGRINWSDWTTDGSKISTTVLAYGRTTSQEGTTNLDFRASDAAVNTTYDARISRASGAVGALSIDNVYDPADTTTDTRGQIDFKINGTAKLTIKQDGTILFGTTPLGVQTGTAPIYGARAFVKLTPQVGSNRTTAFKSGNYSSGTSITTISITGHGLKALDKIRLVFTKTSGTGSVPTSAVYDVISKIDDNTFTVSFTTTANSGTVIAEFVKIAGTAKNVSSVSFKDGLSQYFIVNFATPMPDANYCICGSGQLYPANWYATVTEDTSGTSSYNTINQAFIATSNDTRFCSIIIFG